MARVNTDNTSKLMPSRTSGSPHAIGPASDLASPSFPPRVSQASTCEAEDLIAGSALLLPRARLQESQPDLPLPEGPAIHCLVLREQLIAIKRKPLGSPGLEGLGITDGNAYGTLWKNRDVYAPSMSRPE